MSYRGQLEYNSENSEDSDSFSPTLNRLRFQLTNFNFNSQNNSTNMTEPGTNVLPVLKQEYLNMIPEFNGQTELLPRFIEIRKN
jgi:hypothetical protein